MHTKPFDAAVAAAYRWLADFRLRGLCAGCWRCTAAVSEPALMRSGSCDPVTRN